MPRLTFYGGVLQIGGNKILLEDGDTRLFLDFGTSFADKALFYEEYLNPRPGFGLLDPITMGLLPLLRGLYREDMEQASPNLWDELKGAQGYRDMRDVEIQGVLLSHAHLDHTGHLSFLRCDIPIFGLATTAFISKSIQDSGQSNFETEVVYAVPRELTDAGLLRSANWKQAPALQRPFNLFDLSQITSKGHSFWQSTPSARDLDPVSLGPGDSLGNLEIRCYPVDHSIPGAAAYAIKTSAGWVGYTGDLRLHGGQRELTQRFIQELANLKPIALICEGTRAVDEDINSDNYTEADVEDRALQEIRQSRGLVIADFGPRNVERLQTFARIARETGRGLVIMPRDAYLLKAAHFADSEIPSVADLPDTSVYEDPKSQLNNWEKGIREGYSERLVSPSQIRERQNEYILCFSFYDLNDLPSIRPQKGSLYLYSSHEAFNEELELDFHRLRNWIEHFDMRRVGLPLKELDWEVPPGEQGLHASGHASPHDLLDVVNNISPEKLIPVHTQNPQFFERGLAETGISIDTPTNKGSYIELG